MFAIKHCISKTLSPQIPRTITQTRLLTNTPIRHLEENKGSDQFQGILDVLNGQKQDITEPTLSNNNKPSILSSLNDFALTLQGAGQAPHQIYIHASDNNTIITLTRPNGTPLVTTSGGTAGFKKAARSGYEAAHQAALQLLDKMQAKNLQVHNVHIVLKGFGAGRDAAFKALVSGPSWNVKRITDATPVPFGGCRPKKARRL
ncbi:MAG: hypothetical protein EXX96DRAFT_547713 [Benjaminiella poitrasii]|nr:MAG: hypothetical protein EXX96DRAFT_547713 [Benjaminiella poitrasii]